MKIRMISVGEGTQFGGQEQQTQNCSMSHLLSESEHIASPLEPLVSSLVKLWWHRNQPLTHSWLPSLTVRVECLWWWLACQRHPVISNYYCLAMVTPWLSYALGILQGQGQPSSEYITYYPTHFSLPWQHLSCHGSNNFFLKDWFILLESHRKRSNLYSLVCSQNDCYSQRQTGLKLGTRGFFWVSYLGTGI